MSDNVISFTKDTDTPTQMLDILKNLDIAHMCSTVVTKDGDFYIFDTGFMDDLVAVSYFAEYFERIRKEILSDMLDDNTESL